MSEKRFSDLQAIDGHKNYYRSVKSGIIYYKDQLLGKFSTGKKTIGQAKKVVEIRRLTAGQGISSKVAHRIVEGITSPPLPELFEEFVTEHSVDVGESTAKKYRQDWRNAMAPFWENKTSADIGEDINIKKYKAWYLEYRGTKVARKTVINFKKFCRWLEKNKYLGRLPDLAILDALSETVEKNAQRKKVGRVYDELTEVRSLIEKSKVFHRNPYYCAQTHLGVLLGARCGMRKETEVLSVKWEHLDWTRKVLKVWSKKNHKWREIPLVDEVIDAFRIQYFFTGPQAGCFEPSAGVLALGNGKFEGVLARTPSIWVFPMRTKPDRHLSGQLFDKMWFRIKKFVGLRDYNVKNAARFHDLRHTFASKTADDGWPPKVACEILDMSLKEYDRTYAKASIGKKAEMMEKSFGTTINKEEIGGKST